MLLPPPGKSKRQIADATLDDYNNNEQEINRYSEGRISANRSMTNTYDENDGEYLKMQAGVITNLFRDPHMQFVNYKESEIPELQFMKEGEAEEPKEEPKEAPKEESKEESKTEGEPEKTKEKSKN